MNTKKLEEAVKEAKSSPDRNFTETVDLVVNIKGFKPKKEGDIDFLIQLPNLHERSKVCAIVGPKLLEDAKKNCDKVLSDKDLKRLESREAKKLARRYDFFLAQAQLMPKLAKKMGKILGPLGKMPSPKKGQVLSNKSDVKPITKKLKGSIRVSSRKQKAITVPVGNEKMDNEKIVENIKVILENIDKNIPSSQGAVDTVKLKTTMGEPIEVK